MRRDSFGWRGIMDMCNIGNRGRHDASGKGSMGGWAI